MPSRERAPMYPVLCVADAALGECARLDPRTRARKTGASPGTILASYAGARDSGALLDDGSKAAAAVDEEEGGSSLDEMNSDIAATDG